MKKILFALGLTLITNFTFGQYGQLDNTFGEDGKVTSNLGSAFDNAADILVQDDGKLIVLGSGSNGSTSAFLISRYELDGSIDESFGTNGSTLVQVGTGNNYSMKAGFQTDGKILLSGRANSDVTEFVCLRFLEDGTLDESFAQAGIFKISPSAGYNDLYDMAIQENDKIILGGSGGEDFEDFILLRLNPEGELDTSFGNAGIVQHDVTGSIDRIYAVGIQSKGEIVIAGSVFDTERISIACLMQFNADGSIDSSFGDEGLVTASPGPWASRYRDIHIDEGGGISVVGVLDYDSQYDYLVAKYYENGDLNTEFGEDGFFIKDINGESNHSSKLLVQPDNKMILVGSIGIWPTSSFALFRISPEGVPDNTFGEEGLIRTDFLDGFAYAVGAVLQKDGKVVAGGSATLDDDYVLALSRYTSGLPLGMDKWNVNIFDALVYPNPTISTATLRFTPDRKGQMSIRLFDLTGKQTESYVEEAFFQQGEQSLQLDIKDLKPGIYFLEMSTQDHTQTLKLIRQ